MSMLGKKHTPEAKRRMSEAQRGKKSYWWGKKLSPEHKRKISDALQGKKLSLEHRQKLSKSRQGKKLSPETKQKMSEAKRGEKHHRWKGGRIYSNGYILVLKPDHPHASKGYIVNIV